MKTQIQDQLILSMIEKGIALFDSLNDDQFVEYLNQMNRIRRFMGYETLKKKEFLEIKNHLK